MLKFSEYLLEKQIILGRGSRYGQVALVVGGGGSGKDFAITHFMEGDKFKVLDVDECKRLFIKYAQLKNKYPEIQNLDLRNPKDVFFLHGFLREKNIRNEYLENLLSSTSPDRLPNIIFNITLKDISDIWGTNSMLQTAGYDPKNVHIVWVLSNYSVAVAQNRERSRIVPEDILLSTHEGVATTMYGLIFGKTRLPAMINGEVVVVLGGRNNTVFYPKGETTRVPVVKDFNYIRIKNAGQPIDPPDEIKMKIYGWIVNNIPKTNRTKEIFSSYISST